MIYIWFARPVKQRYALSVGTFGMEKTLVRKLCRNKCVVGLKKIRVTSPFVPYVAHVSRKTEAVIIWLAMYVSMSFAGRAGRAPPMQTIISVHLMVVVSEWWMILLRQVLTLTPLTNHRKRKEVSEGGDASAAAVLVLALPGAVKPGVQFWPW